MNNPALVSGFHVDSHCMIQSLQEQRQPLSSFIRTSVASRKGIGGDKVTQRESTTFRSRRRYSALLRTELHCIVLAIKLIFN